MIPLQALEEVIDRSPIAARIEVLLPIGVRGRQLLVRTLLLGILLVLADHRPAHLCPGIEDADDSGAGDADDRE
jgi:hypothetical protein